jgi:hypothetical protein
VEGAATAERWAIRIVVPAALLCAAAAAILLPHAQPLPAVALGSRWILYALRALALFYGFLLLFVPVVRALHGVLPIELSMRGARWQETSGAVTGALATLDAEVAALERRTTELSELIDRATANLAAGPAGPAPPAEGAS